MCIVFFPKIMLNNQVYSTAWTGSNYVIYLPASDDVQNTQLILLFMLDKRIIFLLVNYL